MHHLISYFIFCLLIYPFHSREKFEKCKDDAPRIKANARIGSPTGDLVVADDDGYRGASYHERVVDHYNNPRNVGSFDKSDPTVGTGLVGAPACGDVMKLQIKVDEGTGKIVDACFKTFRCGSAIASSSVEIYTIPLG